MARPRNDDAYAATRDRLLDAGLDLFRAGSFASVGISDVLKESAAPKGSFYHYFDSKEAFGLDVLRRYHAQQVDSARSVLHAPGRPAIERLRAFFEQALTHFTESAFKKGCLMCNLSTELADERPAFQALLQEHWAGLSTEIAVCISELDKAEIGLTHLSDAEAADWLLNSWSGALTRMKAMRSAEPLTLFIKTTFKSNA